MKYKLVLDIRQRQFSQRKSIIPIEGNEAISKRIKSIEGLKALGREQETCVDMATERFLQTSKQHIDVSNKQV